MRGRPADARRAAPARLGDGPAPFLPRVEQAGKQPWLVSLVLDVCPHCLSAARDSVCWHDD